VELTQGNGGTSSNGSGRRLSDQDLDQMVDAYFDRELSVGQRRRMFDELSGQGSRCEDIARMQRILAQLREPPEQIDIADDVIAQIHRRRSFLSPRMRAAIRVGRMAVAASVLLALLGIVVVQRIAPDTTTLTAESTPVTSLMQDTGEDLSRLRTSLAGVSEQAAIVLQPLVKATLDEGNQSMELTIHMDEYASYAPGAERTYPAGAPSQMLIMSAAGDATSATGWYGEDDLDAAPRGFVLEADSNWPRGFRTVKSGVISTELSSGANGERARVVPYYVEHFEAGALPVSIDPEAFGGVLRLISRKPEALKASDDPDR
jgi:hypothetical protein